MIEMRNVVVAGKNRVRYDDPRQLHGNEGIRKATKEDFFSRSYSAQNK
jgi:hypothetical protein